ncbi:hypothetical protein D3C81_1636560 [compost metagenome]
MIPVKRSRVGSQCSVAMGSKPLSTHQLAAQTSRLQATSTSNVMFAIHVGGRRDSGLRSRYNAPSADSDIHCTISDSAPNSTQRLPLCSGANARMMARPSPARIVQMIAGAFHRVSSGVRVGCFGMGGRRVAIGHERCAAHRSVSDGRAGLA